METLHGAVLLSLLLVLGAFGLGHAQISHECRHKPPTLSEVSYAARATTGHTIKKRQEVAYQPIRIVPYYTPEFEGLSNESRMRFKEDIEIAIMTLQSLLSVIPLNENLLLSRRCTEHDNNIINRRGYCTEGCNTTMCGVVQVPEQHLGICRICNSSGENCHFEAIAGPGAANTDFLLYVTASDNNCGSNTLAFAAHCQLDLNSDRPVAGYTNLCPSNLNRFNDFYDRDSIQRLLIHEMMHALGFSSSLYAFFRDKDGNPRTPRDSYGFPMNGIIEEIHQVYRPLTSTLSIRTVARESVNGLFNKTIYELTTPAIVREGRAHFNCSSLEGVELEDGGGSFAAFTHWEERILDNELMTGIIALNAVISRITLALFEDSGWYEVNYDNAELLRYGLNFGCSFIEGSCLTHGLTTTPFCSELQYSDYVSSGRVTRYSGSDGSCHYDRRSVSACTLINDANPPAAYQYFANPSYGSFYEIYDYCPIQEGQLSCIAAEHQPAAGMNAFGEVLGHQSRCFNFEIRTEWTRQGNTVNPQKGGACYEAYCEKDLGGVIVNLLGSNFTCDSPEKEIELSNDMPGSYSVNITILCPRCEDICWDVLETCNSVVATESAASLLSPTPSALMSSVVTGLYLIYSWLH